MKASPTIAMVSDLTVLISPRQVSEPASTGPQLNRAGSILNTVSDENLNPTLPTDATEAQGKVQKPPSEYGWAPGILA